MTGAEACAYRPEKKRLTEKARFVICGLINIYVVLRKSLLLSTIHALHTRASRGIVLYFVKRHGMQLGHFSVLLLPALH